MLVFVNVPFWFFPLLVLVLLFVCFLFFVCFVVF